MFISVIKALEVMASKQLRKCCEAAWREFGDLQPEVPCSRNIVRSKGVPVPDLDTVDSRDVSRMNTLLTNIRQGRVTLSMEIEDYDKLNVEVIR